MKKLPSCQKKSPLIREGKKLVKKKSAAGIWAGRIDLLGLLLLRSESNRFFI